MTKHKKKKKQDPIPQTKDQVLRGFGQEFSSDVLSYSYNAITKLINSNYVSKEESIEIVAMALVKLAEIINNLNQQQIGGEIEQEKK